MPQITTLDVIWIPDDTIAPPGPKMVACIHAKNGWYYRINTRDHWRPCVGLAREPDHLFLDHDSYLQCGDPLDLDDYVIEESISRRGIIGRISPSVCGEIIACLANALYLSDDDKEQIREALSACIP